MQIKCALGTEEINKAVKQIKLYREAVERKTEQLVSELAQAGYKVIEANMANVQGDSDPHHMTYIKYHSYGTFFRATLYLEGKDILFIEFGAGVHYNGHVGGSPHPKGSDLGYVIGGYGLGLGKNDFWYYTDDTGASHRSYGTKAQMPMYQADLAIANNVIEIARRVLNSG